MKQSLSHFVRVVLK